MSLSRVERERVSDSRLKIQSAVETLKDVDPEKISNYEEIQSCLAMADKHLDGALRA